MSSNSFLSKAVTVVLFGSLSFSCTNQNNEIVNDGVFEIPVNLKKANNPVCDTLKLSDLIDSVTYVTLETNPDCLIGEIKDLRFIDGYYYISQIGQPLLVFDASGHFVRRVGSIGRGPGEYLVATAFDIRLGSNEVSIYDEYSKKVNVYSSKGEFLRSFMTHDFARDMAVNTESEYYFYDPIYEFSQYKRGLWKTDSLGNYLETLVSIDSKFKWSSGIQPKFFRHVEDTVCIMGAEDKDLLYHIIDGKVEVPYHVKVDIEMSKRLKKKSRSEDIKPFDAYVKLGHQETSRFIFFSVCDYTLAARADIIHDKKMDKTYYMGESTIFDADICLFFVPFMYSEKDRFMSVADITAFADYNDLKKAFPTISEQSNPIIVVYHTKK